MLLLAHSSLNHQLQPCLKAEQVYTAVRLTQAPSGVKRNPTTVLSILQWLQVPIPDHMDIYHLHQEAEPSDRTALQAVVDHIEAEVARLNALEEHIMMEYGPEDERLQVCQLPILPVPTQQHVSIQATVEAALLRPCQCCTHSMHATIIFTEDAPFYWQYAIRRHFGRGSSLSLTEALLLF